MMGTGVRMGMVNIPGTAPSGGAQGPVREPQS